MWKWLTLPVVVLISACSTTTAPPLNDAVSGPVVSGVLKGTEKPSYIQFSDYASGKPVIATEAYANQPSGPVIFKRSNMARNGLQISTSPLTGHSSGAQPLGMAAEYLHIGGGEYNNGINMGIGFGYAYGGSPNSPCYIGYVQNSNISNTYGSLLFGCRSTTTNVPPSNLWTMSGGDFIAPTAYVTPPTARSVATKGYVDTATASKVSGAAGATSARPALSDANAGFMFFDTTISTPVWWNGTAWVDATGSAR